MNTNATMKVALPPRSRTSTEGLQDDLKGLGGAPVARASRNRRKMFSTSMIASSTTSPMAIAGSPSVRCSGSHPSRVRTMIATSRDSGMAVKMNATRRLNRRIQEHDGDEGHRRSAAPCRCCAQ